MSENKHFIKGKSLASEGNYSASAEAYSKAIEREENPLIYYERAMAYLHLEKNEEALQDLNHAQQLDPENPFRYSSRAYIKDKMGDSEGAIEDYKMAIRLDPEDAIAHNNLGLLEEKAGFAEMAKERFSRADDLANKNGSLKHQEINPENDIINNGSHSLQHFTLHPDETGRKGNYTSRNYWKQILKVFTEKSTLKEFFRFIWRGGKIS